MCSQITAPFEEVKLSSQHRPFLRTRQALVIAVALVFLSACSLFPPWINPRFHNIEAAVAAGAVDPELLIKLNSTGRTTALLVLAAPTLTVRYRDDESPIHSQWSALQNYKLELARAKQGLRSESRELEVIRTYDSLPVELVVIRSVPALLSLINSRWITGIAADGTNVLFSSANLQVINAVTTQSWGQSGAGVGVAVLDGLVDVGNSAFGSCTAAGQTCTVRAQQAFGSSMATSAHGTNVAGIVLSVAPAAHIISLGVLNNDQTIDDSTALAAINWVVANRETHRIKAVNMSFGRANTHWSNECTMPTILGRNPFQHAFSVLRGLGILPVVSAGNHAVQAGRFVNGISLPACTPGAVAVGAVYDSNVGSVQWTNCTDVSTGLDQPTCFSQSSSYMGIWAPGEGITAAGITMGGTSMAAPHVSGAFAVLAANEPYERLPVLAAALTTSGPLITDGRNSFTKRRLDLSAALSARAPTPANDAMATAVAFNGNRATASQLNWTAGKEPSEPQHAGNPGGGSLWYRWKAPYSGPASIDTSGSEFDTLLAVYTGQGMSSLSLIAANDDRAIGERTSVVTFQATQNVEYLVAVDGKRVLGATSRGRLSVMLNGDVSNDTIASAQALAFQVPARGANFGASKEPGEPRHCQNQGGASVWYRWTATQTGSVTASSANDGVGFMRCVSVYRLVGPLAVGNLVRVAGGQWSSPDDTYSATFAASANETYYIVVDGISSEEPRYDAPARGQFILTLGP